MTIISRQVEKALLGQADAVEALRRIDTEGVLEAVRGMHLVLRRDAVISVLCQFKNGEIEPAAAQRWASFVRRGHVQGQPHAGPLEPIEVEWELPYEGAISEAISRLDELGDLVDGELTDGEAEALIADLACRN